MKHRTDAELFDIVGAAMKRLEADHVLDYGAGSADAIIVRRELYDRGRADERAEGRMYTEEELDMVESAYLLRVKTHGGRMPGSIRAGLRSALARLGIHPSCPDCSCEPAEQDSLDTWRVGAKLAQSPAAQTELQVPTDVHEHGWQWRPIDADTAFAPPFGTIRACVGCGALVAGGPSSCSRCAQSPGGKAE